MTQTTHLTHKDPVLKERKSRSQKFLRLLKATLDPRAWGHLLKLVNFFNYSHVTALRNMTMGTDLSICPTAVFHNAHNITLGNRVEIGTNNIFMGGPGQGKIIIGDDVLFAPNVLLTVTNYRFDQGGPVTAQELKEADIVIGRDVWLGAGVVVLAGTTIGDGAIIGAGVVLRGDVPAWAVIVGAEPQLIRQRKPYDMDKPAP